jgi:hypothetical protein
VIHPSHRVAWPITLSLIQFCFYQALRLVLVGILVCREKA